MATRRRNASKRSVRRRVAKALKKYVRGNPRGGMNWRGEYRVHYSDGGVRTMHAADGGKRAAAKLERALRDGKKRGIVRSFERLNPASVKGRKVKGGRAVTLRNFTGTIVKKSDGTVGILGRGRRK